MNENVYYYTIKEDNTICLLRVYGNSPIIKVPERINALLVTEIGSYCFSKTNKCKKDVLKTEGDPSFLCEVAGEFIQEVYLPDTIKKINSYAFYNCRKLKKLFFTSSIQEIGSDVFLNCLQLHQLSLHCDYKEATVLKLVLKQITWDVDVYFINDSIDLVLSFPEYYENYDVIGPAHIFGMNISGEGYRARQCFSNNILLIQEYDTVFDKLQVEESTKVLSHFVFNRLFYPVQLNQSSFEQYERYIKEHSFETALPILLNKDISNIQKRNELEFLIEKQYIDLDTVNQLIEIASQNQMVEILTYLIQWKKKYYSKKRRYEFEDF